MPSNDHYIPQFYLKNFSIKNRYEFVYAYKRNELPFAVRVSNVAAIKDFYTVTDPITGESSREVESLLSMIEGKAAPILRRIGFDANVHLTPEEAWYLLSFIAFLITRTPWFHKRTASFLRGERNAILEYMERNKNEFAEMLQRGGSEDKVRQVLKKPEARYNSSVNPTETQLILLALQTTPYIAKMLAKRHWHLLESNSSRVFVTSDNPISVFTDKYPTGHAIGLLNANIALPVSPTRCLYINDEPAVGRIHLINRKQVNYVNWFTMFYAHRFIFSNLQSKDFQKDFGNTTEGAYDKVITFGKNFERVD
jgi:hypothetical protein